MARSCNVRRLLSVVAAAFVLGYSAVIAWAQTSPSTDSWEKKLAGKWCDADRGCTHWWNQYEVIMQDDNSIVVKYRGRDDTFIIFEGAIQENAGKWLIDGHKLDGDGKQLEEKDNAFKAWVNELEGVREVIEGKIKGSLRAKIQSVEIAAGMHLQEIKGITIGEAWIENPEMEGNKLKAKTIQGKTITGGKQVEISVPIDISDATIEGSTKAKGKKARGGDDDDDDDGKKDGDSKKIEMSGTIKGKVVMPAGSANTWKGDFTGTFTALVQATIKGTYFALPLRCSVMGASLSDSDKRDLSRRDRYKGESKPYKEESNKGGSKPYKGDLQPPGRHRLFWLGEQSEQGKQSVGGIPGIVAAGPGKARAAAPPPEPKPTGRFLREVKGTVNVLKPRTITLELPAMPLLDDKCVVRDELPKRTLKLVRQYEDSR